MFIQIEVNSMVDAVLRANVLQYKVGPLPVDIAVGNQTQTGALPFLGVQNTRAEETSEPTRPQLTGMLRERVKAEQKAASILDHGTVEFLVAKKYALVEKSSRAAPSLLARCPPRG